MTHLLTRLRKWLVPLEQTPFHPQWLVLRQKRFLLAWCRSKAHGVVLDVGCGNGWLRQQINEDVRYVGLDYPSTVALGYAGKPDIFADAESLPVAGASCNTVVILDVIEHVARPNLALREVHRVLKPGGVCLIHVPFMYPLHDEPHDYQRLTRYGLEQAVREVGLETVEIVASTGAIEAAGALLSIALAKGVVESFQFRHWSALLTPIAVILILVINILSRVLGLLYPKSTFMPFSYRLVARKGKKLPRPVIDGKDFG